MSLEGTRFSRDISGIDNRANAVHVKALYGLSDRIDLWAQLGLIKLHLENVDSTGMSLSDDYIPAAGAGFNYRFADWTGPKLTLIAGVSFYTFHANPSAENRLFVANTEVKEILELSYDWREANVNVGAARDFGFMDFYAGVNFKYIDRPETKRTRLLFGEETTTTANQRGKYESGLLLIPGLGMDFKFNARFKLSVGISGSSQSDYAFFVGLSQTGQP